jgi:hypothetical protein
MWNQGCWIRQQRHRLSASRAGRDVDQAQKCNPGSWIIRHRGTRIEPCRLSPRGARRMNHASLQRSRTTAAGWRACWQASFRGQDGIEACWQARAVEALPLPACRQGRSASCIAFEACRQGKKGTEMLLTVCWQAAITGQGIIHEGGFGPSPKSACQQVSGTPHVVRNACQQAFAPL